MDSTNFYYKQVVGEDDMDLSFEQVRAALRQQELDIGAVGIKAGGDIVEASPTPNMTVELDTPLVGVDADGNRIYVASEDPIDVSVDSNAVSTAVIGGGNEKYVSVFVRYTTVQSDPRIDGNSNVVYWLVSASHEIVVVQGAEAPAGTATPPSLLADALLCGDVLLYSGMTEVLDADIDLSRQQLAFALTSTNYDINAGTQVAALEAMLTILDDHIADVSGVHAAEAVSFDATGTQFEDANPDNVQLALEECYTTGTVDYPGQVIQQPLRLRTHDFTLGDWRELATTHAQTFAGTEGPVPGVGGTFDVEVASLTVGSGATGLIELSDAGVYTIEAMLIAYVEDGPSEPAYAEKSTIFVGRVRNYLGALTLLTPNINTPAGDANMTTVTLIAGTTDLYLRIIAAAALSGYNIRYVAHIRVQRCIWV